MRSNKNLVQLKSAIKFKIHVYLPVYLKFAGCLSSQISFQSVGLITIDHPLGLRRIPPKKTIDIMTIMLFSK